MAMPVDAIKASLAQYTLFAHTSTMHSVECALTHIITNNKKISNEFQVGRFALKSRRFIVEKSKNSILPTI